MSARGILLDTNALLWLVDPHLGHLGPDTMALLHSGQRVHFSVASIWEARIKAERGRLALPDGFAAGLGGFGLAELPITGAHGDGIGHVTLPHADLFDRLIATQAWTESLVLVTSDRRLLHCPDIESQDARS